MAQTNKRFEPTQEQRELVLLATGALGYSEDQVARLVINPDTERPITAKTLRRCFRDELDRAQEKTLSAVAGNLFRVACTPSKEGVTAAIFWMKTRGKWSETTNLNLGGPNGQPLFTPSDVDDAVAALLGRTVPGAAGGGAAQAPGDAQAGGDPAAPA